MGARSGTDGCVGEVGLGMRRRVATEVEGWDAHVTRKGPEKGMQRRGTCGGGWDAPKGAGKGGQGAECMGGVPVRAGTQCGSVCGRDAGGAQSASVRGV